MTPEQKQYILEHLHKQTVAEIARALGLREREVRKFLEKERAQTGKAPQIDSKKSSPAPGGSALFTLLAAALIVALAAGIYINVLHGKFLLDDNLLIVDNAYIKSWSYLPMFFTKGIGEVVGATSTYYRPLQVLAYTALYHFWRLNTFPYHLLNVIFHVLAGLAVFWMIKTLFKDRILALFATVLYIVHPAHVESVAYISGLGDCMVVFLTVLTFVFYIKQSESRGVVSSGFYILTVVSFIIMLFVKENGIIFIGLVVLYHLAFRRRIKIVTFLTVLVITVAYLVFRASLSKTGAAELSVSAIIQRVPGFFVALSIYAEILPMPFDLYMGHENAIFPLTYPQAVIGMVLFAVTLAIAVWSWKRYPLIFFSIGWFYIALAPVSNLYPIAFYMADHYLYLPSIGFFLVVGKGFRILYDKGALRFIAVISVVILTIYYANLTVIQNYYWKDPIFFYKRTLAYAPYSGRMYSNLAKEYAFDKDPEKAIALYKQAVTVDPKHTVAYYNLGASYFRLGKYDEAISYCKKALETDPKYASSYNIIGAACLATGKVDEAIEAFRAGLAIYPNHIDTMLNLASAYYTKGKIYEAIGILEDIIRKNPEYAVAYSNLGYIYVGQAKFDEAIPLFKKAIALDPRYVDAYNNLGYSFYKTGKTEEAIDMFKKTLELDPNNKRAKENLAVIEQERAKISSPTP